MLHFKKFLACSSGNVAMIFAFASTACVGVAGVAITFGQINNQKTHLQQSLDAAVLAGTALPYSASASERIDTAMRIFDENSNGAGKFDQETRVRDFKVNQSPEIIFSVKGANVTGNASSLVQGGLASVLGIGSTKITAASSAIRLDSDPVCVLALTPSSPNGLEVYGNASFNANNCAVQANSENSAGMRTYGKGRASASQFGVTGNFTGTSFEPMPYTDIEPVVDPYKSLPVPIAGPCLNVSTKLTGESITLDPGTYCGGVNIKAGSNITFNPGSYIMKDGTLSINSGSKLTGNEVTIFFVGANSYLHMLSDSEAKLTSPKSGTYKNIQMMSDRDLSASKFNEEWTTILSGAKLDFDGVLYMPEQQFLVSGTAHEAIITGTSPTMMLVTDKIWAQGNAVFNLTQEDKRGIGADTGLATFSYGSRIIR
jgi:Flp pilus assembly protein TadG